MAAAGGANNSKGTRGDAWPTREKRRQLAMEGVMEVGESFKFLRRLSPLAMDEMKEGDCRKEEGIDEKDWMKEEEEEEEEKAEKKEPDGAHEEDGRKEKVGAKGDDLAKGKGKDKDVMEDVPVEEEPGLPADGVVQALRQELWQAQANEDLARWQGYQEGVDWALDSVEHMEAEHGSKDDGNKGRHGKGSAYKGKPGKGKGKNQKGHGSGGKGKHARKGWHHTHDGNKPHWAKQKWRQEPLPQESSAFGTAGAKGTGKGKYDAWGGEYCIGGYRAVSGEFYP